MLADAQASSDAGDGDEALEASTFKVSCTDRACSWLVDAGTGGCPAGGQPCTLTCPAPTCAVITKQNELKQTILACAAPNQ